MGRELHGLLTAKHLALGGGLLVLLVVGGKCGLDAMFRSGEEHNAQERVRRLFDGMKPGGNVEQAICVWYRGALRLNQEEFNQAADLFDAWQRSAELPTVSTYEIREVQIVADTGLIGGATVRVSGTVNGRSFALRVKQGDPLAWDVAPR